MNEQELRQQIDMFFKGELSDTEEQGLRDYLATHEVPEDLFKRSASFYLLYPIVRYIFPIIWKKNYRHT